jgi:hypothetical protein
MTEERETTITAGACDVIARIGDYVAAIRDAYGPDSVYAVDMTQSALRAIGQAFRLVHNGGRLAAWSHLETTLSLSGVTHYGMTFGVVFFPDHAFDNCVVYSVTQNTVMACVGHGLPAVDEKVCATPDANGRFCFVRETPWPGMWSLHS